MRVTTHHQIDIDALAENICHLPKMPLDFVRADVALGRSLIGSSPLFVASGSEIGEADGYAEAWVDGMTGMHTYGRDVEAPVSVSHGFKVLSHRVRRRITIGVPHITPDRPLTEVLTEVAGFKVAVLGTHNVSSSKNPRADHLSLRKRLFSTWRRKLRRRIRQLHRLGFTVYVMGDFNSPQPVSLHPDQVVALCRDLMQIIIVPAAGVNVPFGPNGPARYARGHTDHVIGAVTTRLTRTAVTGS